MTQPAVDERTLRCATALEALQLRVAAAPALPLFGFLDEAGVRLRLTVSETLERVTEVAAGLVAAGVRRGEPILLMLPPDETFVVALLGAQRAGALPVAAYPPTSPRRLDAQAATAAGILEDCDARWVISGGLLAPFADLLGRRHGGPLGVLRLERLGPAPGVDLPPLPGPDELAFLQYTSGSTGDPKGVAITQRSLTAQLWALGQALPGMRCPVRRAAQRVVSWLPPYHDMGLVGCIFYPVYWGVQVLLASPLLFIRKPWLWLRWISEQRATQTVAPNFAYERLASRVSERYLRDLDLSSLEVAWNGAEPISADTIRRFTQRFAPQGLAATTMFPVYGLAENTLCAAHAQAERATVIDRISRSALEERGEAVPVADAAGSVEVVSVGQPACGTELVVVDPEGLPCPERVCGEIRLRGDSAMHGYYRRPRGPEWDAAGWLCTGDVGYLAEGQLYVVGRRGDLIIVSGRNVFPHDVERAAAAVPGASAGRVVAFGVPDGKGSEALVVCAELSPEPASTADHPALRRAIRARVTDTLGVSPARVELVARGWILKTSSGKPRRRACRERYLQA